MTNEQQIFEAVLDAVCIQLTTEARTSGFRNAAEFESRVRTVLADTADALGGVVHVERTASAQQFPDVIAAPYGVEVKFTLSDSWRCIGNSVRESHRVTGVKYIYLVYGKMGGCPEVRWADYADSIVHVRTSHVPRFEVAIRGKTDDEPLFAELGVSYDDFISLDMQGKMEYIRDYAKSKHPNDKLWWIEYDKDDNPHTLPVEARLYTDLDTEHKNKYRAEAALLCPRIVAGGRDRRKYADVVMYLATYHGVLCYQVRDLFSAGSVAIPGNKERGGIYIERALKILEPYMLDATQYMRGDLFKEYWGADYPRDERIREWLRRADEFATEWTPSLSLFQ